MPPRKILPASVPCHHVARRKPRRRRDIELFGRHAARDHLDDRLVRRNAEKLVRLAVGPRRDAPVEYAVRHAEVVEGVAEVHHEYPAVNVAVMPLPPPPHGGEVTRHDKDLVGVSAESARPALRGEEPVPQRRIIDDVDPRVLAVAGARSGKGKLDRGLDRLCGDRSREMAADVAGCCELRERSVLRGEELASRDMRLDSRRDVAPRGEEGVETRHRIRLAAVQLAVCAENGDGMSHLAVLRAETSFKGVHEVHQVQDGAFAESEPAARHREPLFEDVVSHHDLGARSGLAVQMQRTCVLHELSFVVAERARRLEAHLRALPPGDQRPFEFS